MVSDIFDPDAWEPVTDEFDDITYHRGVDVPVVRIAFDRPEVRNAFRPGTVDELRRRARPRAQAGRRWLRAAHRQRPLGEGRRLGILLRRRPVGARRLRLRSTVTTTRRATRTTRSSKEARAGRLHVLEVQRLIRFMPKPVVAVVPGWAVGGGHSLHVICDLTLASEEHAKFLQTDPDVASFDGGFGSAYLAKQIGQKRPARCSSAGRPTQPKRGRRHGDGQRGDSPRGTGGGRDRWADEMTKKSPTAMRMLKYAFNMTDDGMVGQQVFAGEATRLAYMTDEAQEGRDAFLEKRDPEFRDYPWHY